MSQRFTDDARAVVIRAQEQARRLGQPFIGCEHLLYGLATTDGSIGAVLRDRGVTAERVETEFVRMIGPRLAAARSVFDELDRDALADLGIDLDKVRLRVEAVFGPEAFARRMPVPRRWRARRCHASAMPTGHLRPTRRARACIKRSIREARAGHRAAPDVEHLALALLRTKDGLHLPILSAIGAPAPQLREAILNLNS